MRRKGLGLLAMVVMLVVMLSACGSSKNEGGASSSPSSTPSASPTQNASASAEEVTLKVSGFKSGTELGAIPELNEKFMSENPQALKLFTKECPAASSKNSSRPVSQQAMLPMSS